MADSTTNLEDEAMIVEPSHELQTRSAEADIEQEPQVQELPNGFLNSDWTPFPTDYRLHRDPLAHNAGQPLDGPKLAHSDMDFAEISERLKDQMQSRLQGHAAQEPNPTRKYERESGVIMIDDDDQGYAAGVFSVAPAHNGTRHVQEPDVDMDQHPPLEDSAHAPKKPKKRKSKKRSKKAHLQHDHNDVPPTSAQPGEPLNAYPRDAEHEHTQEQWKEEQQVIRQWDHPLQDQQYDYTQYPAQQHRFATPHQAQYHGTSSPHSQLDQDLQAATELSNQVTAQRSMPPPMIDRGLRGLPVFQVQAPTSLHHSMHPAFTPTAGLADSSTVPPGFDRNGAARRPTFNTEDNSTVDQTPSSDIEVDFHHLYRRVNKKSTCKVTQLAAEKQSLQDELHQAIGTRDALQDQMLTLQREKETLTTSLKQEQTEHTKIKVKVGHFKKFVDGLGNDISRLRKDADAYPVQIQELADEANSPQQQLSSLAEKSQRLNEKVIRECQAAKSSLSAAAVRTTHLEENLKERSDALAEEKKLRLQLQSQLISVNHGDDSVLRQMKSNNDAVLDKLYEIHAMLEVSDNHQELTEMMEKIAAAIQGLNSQQTASGDDVISVKGMIESLTENMSRAADDRDSQHEEKLSGLQSRIRELELELQLKASEVTSLQERLESAPSTVPISAEDVESIRKDAIAFHAQQQAEMENELKKLRTRPSKDEILRLREEVSEAHRQADSRQQDVESLKAQLENEKQAHSTARSLADSRQQDVESLNARLDHETHQYENKLRDRPSKEDLKTAREQRSEAQKLANRCQQNIEALNTQLEDEKRAHSAAQNLADTRQQDVDRLNGQLANEKQVFETRLAACPSDEELSRITIQLSAAQQLVNSKEQINDTLTAQLEKERQMIDQLKNGHEQYKTSCDAAVASERERADKKVEALQQRLTQAQDDLQAKADAEEEFRATVAQSWEEERTKFDEERVSLHKQIEKARQRQAEVPIQGAEAVEEQATVRDDSPVVQESQQQDTLPLFANLHARRNYVDTQDAHSHLEDSLFPENDDKENEFTYEKPQVAPNSSSKRRALTPKQLSTLSSSPGFVSSQKRRQSTTYGGSSAHKRRPSHGKEAPKRKADRGQVIEGYEEERRKRIKPAAPSRPNLRSQTPGVPNMLNMPTLNTFNGKAHSSSQGSSRGRAMRSKTDEMNARFAQELPTNKRRQSARQK